MSARRSTSSNSSAVILAVIVIVVVAAVYMWVQNHPQFATPTAPRENPTLAPPSTFPPDMMLGNPSGASASVSDKDNYLMVKKHYCLSYNNSKGIPNWVSWKLDASDLGDAPRKRVFDPDDTLPPGFRRITSPSYSGSGFDRGHMCPHSDRAADEEMSYSTFVMTNIIPQAPNVNEKAWAQLEAYCRELVRKHQQHLYIISGPAGQGGVGNAGRKEVIGRGTVVVPAECWKIIVSVPESGGDDDRSKISVNTRVIAVVMPNDDTVGETWAQYRTTPAEIEGKTGLSFFTNLPPDVAQGLRRKTDTTHIDPPRPFGRGGN